MRRLPPGVACAVLAALLLALPPAGRAQPPPPAKAEEPGSAEAPPRSAGTDVPAPKRTRFVAPTYPLEAQIQGLRGIVILELVLNEAGKVATADVIRSVPPFDEAALSAARQWEYEVTKVDGRPVRVRLTVPITFALKLPDMSREDGIPELRQGALPPFPQGAQGPAKVVAEVRLLPDGSVAEAAIKTGGSPWAEALLQALRTWRFAWEGEGSIAFDVEADFGTATGNATPRVDLKLHGLKRQETPPAPTAGGEPPAAPGATPPASPEPVVSPSPAMSAPPTLPSPAAPGSPAETAPPPGPAPDIALPVPQPSPTPPPVEIISGAPATPAPPPPPPPQPGVSSVRDVNLAIGVPDLVKGRRPVVPPLARLSGAEGRVEVDFAVDAAGGVSVQDVRGPELLKEAARQTVASWSFRRTTAERLYVRAVLTYAGEQVRADVAPRGAE